MPTKNEPEAAASGSRVYSPASSGDGGIGVLHVYALKQGPVIEIARRVVCQNGYQERVTFVSDWSTSVEPPEPADVLVTETIGSIG